MKPDSIQKRIEAYLEGRMKTEEQDAFEADLETNSELLETYNLFKMEKEALRLLSQQGLRSQMQYWKAEKEGTNKEAKVIRPNFRRNMIYRLSAAASVAIIIGLGIAFWQGSQHDNQSLAGDGFVTTQLGDRGNIPALSPLVPVMDTLNAGDYEAALQILQLLQGSDYKENALLLEGEIYYQRQNWQAALTTYETLINTGKNISNIQKAEWNRANTLLAADRESEALSQLNRIAQQEGHAFSEEAKALIDKLHSIWRYFTI